MASLKDLVKAALDKKQGTQHSDAHDAVTRTDAKLGSAPKAPQGGGAKPQKKAAGRGR